MSTISAPNRRKDPFSRVAKVILDDTRLSWRAKGIVAYLIGKPPGWRLQVSDLVKHGTDGEHAIRAALNELRDHGYAQFTRFRSGGTFSQGHWEISDHPDYSPRCDFPDVEEPSVEDQDLSKNDSNKNDCNEKERGESAETQKQTLKTPSPSSPHFAAPSSPAPPMFRPPLAWVPEWEEVKEWAEEKRWPIEKAAEFFNYYDAINWEVKGSKLKNWRAKAQSWLNRWREEKKSKPAGCNV